MSVRTWAGRFSIVEGQVREEGPWLGVFARRPADDEERTLHVLVEPALPGSEDICSQLVEVMGHLFQRENLSLTGALARSLRAAHDNLRDWNRKSLREHQVGAGSSCLILRGRTAFLAQVGPSLAFFFRDGELTRLVPQEPSAQDPLGLADDLRPELSGFDLSPGDLLLVVSSRLASVADQAVVAGVLSRGADDALAELYLLTRDFANFSALLVSCFEQPDQASEADGSEVAPPASGDSPSAAVPTRPSRQATSLFDEGGGPGGPAITPMGPNADSHGGPQSPAGGGSAPGGGGGRPAAVMEPQRPYPGRIAPYPPELDRDGSSRRNGGNGHAPPSRAHYGPGTRIDSARTRTARPVVRLRGPESAPRYRFQRTTSPRIRYLTMSWLWVLLAAVLGFVVLLATCTLASSSSPDQGTPSADFQALLGEANTAYRGALSVDDPAARRTRLNSVLDQLDEAELMQPGDPDAAALRAEVRSAIAGLDAVVELGELQLVVDMGPLVSGELSASRLIAGGGSVFVLDDAGGRVLEVSLGDVSPDGVPLVRTVFQQGELAGVVLAARPRFIMWSRQESRGSLLILDESRRLFSYTPGGAALPLVVRDAQEWESLDGAAAYAGNLYILDEASHQVWRYLPTESGFDSERSPVLGEVDLQGGRDLAVDGDVYLLTGDRGLRRFVDGEEQPFSMTGIDRGLLSPTSLTRDGGDGLLLTDRGNKRLVLFDAEGRFRRQLVSVTFTDLRSAAVDPEAGRLYALVGDSIFAADLPTP